jgi:hypothetical protein
MLLRDVAAMAAKRNRLVEHDPEKWIPVFPRDKREAFARRSCSNKELERDDDSKKSHHALAAYSFGYQSGRADNSLGLIVFETSLAAAITGHFLVSEFL